MACLLHEENQWDWSIMKITTSQVDKSNYPKKSYLRTLKVAREFEAIFSSFMLRSMRKTIFSDGLLSKSMGEKIYTDMLDSEYAKLLSRNASWGLAEQITKQIYEMNPNHDDSILKRLQGLGRNTWMIDNHFIAKEEKPISFSYYAKRVHEFDSLINEASVQYQVDRHLIAAIIAQESAGNPIAVSRKGAKGLMQIIDSTAAMMGINQVFNPRENIFGGTKYLKQMLDKFNGNEVFALASYNAGPGAIEKYKGVPPYKETQQYVKRVLHFKKLFTDQSINEKDR